MIHHRVFYFIFRTDFVLTRHKDTSLSIIESPFLTKRLRQTIFTFVKYFILELFKNNKMLIWQML